MGRETLFFGSIIIVVFAIITLLFPIELYDGHAIYNDGTVAEEKISLSYLIHKEGFLAQYEEFGVVDIQLNNLGWIMIGIINFGFPMLLGYRIALKRIKRKSQQDV